jgi:hypothetical protein
VFVIENVAVVAIPETEAVTEYDPICPFAVAVTLAMPALFVVAVALDSTALAPDDGALKFTVMPEPAGLPNESCTTAARGCAKALLVPAVCGLPELTAMAAAFPGLLVSENVAGVLTPATDAVSL